MKSFGAKRPAIEKWVSLLIWLSIASIGFVMMPLLLLPTVAQIDNPQSDNLVSFETVDKADEDETVDAFIEGMMAERQLPGLS